MQPVINTNEKVYIIILNYKKWQDVVECLESVLKLNYTNFSVIVIDNYSQNNSLAHLQAWLDDYVTNGINENIKSPITYKHFHKPELISNQVDVKTFPKIVFIQNDENNGFASGNNEALKLLQNQDAYIWLLNPDMVVAPSALSELVTFAQQHPFKSLIGSVIKYYDEPEKIQSYGAGSINFNMGTITITKRPEQIATIDYINGGSLFTHAKHFKELGLLPEDYFLFWEETDWCYNAKRNGYQLLICPSSVCYHKVSSTIGSGQFAYYYYTRNGLLFLKKYKKQKLPLAICFQLLSIIRRLATGQADRAKGIYQGLSAFLKQGNENK